MTIVRYQPWGLVNRLHREFGQLFGDAAAAATGAERTAAWSPSVDVREDGQRFVLQADLPGVEAKDISVTAENGVLTLRGERHIERQENKDGYQRLERAEGAFERRFALPDNVRSEEISARHANGVLEIVIPKQAAPEPRRVPINVN
ncbi:MAG: Hsp20/alpha crystallin family protein [Steroidobacteraceae bacterium]